MVRDLSKHMRSLRSFTDQPRAHSERLRENEWEDGYSYKEQWTLSLNTLTYFGGVRVGGD